MTVSELIKALRKMPQDAVVLSGNLGEFPHNLRQITQVEHTTVCIDPASTGDLPDFLKKDTVEILTGSKVEESVERNHTTGRQLLHTLLHESINLDYEIRAVMIEGCGGVLLDIDGICPLESGMLGLFVGTPAELARAEGEQFLILKTHAEAKKKCG